MPVRTAEQACWYRSPGGVCFLPTSPLPMRPLPMLDQAQLFQEAGRPRLPAWAPAAGMAEARSKQRPALGPWGPGASPLGTVPVPAPWPDLGICDLTVSD